MFRWPPSKTPPKPAPPQQVPQRPNTAWPTEDEAPPRLDPYRRCPERCRHDLGRGVTLAELCRRPDDEAA